MPKLIENCKIILILNTTRYVSRNMYECNRILISIAFYKNEIYELTVSAYAIDFPR
jgi:hypothetical protein